MIVEVFVSLNIDVPVIAGYEEREEPMDQEESDKMEKKATQETNVQ